MPTLEIEEKVARLEGRIDEHSKFFESISTKLTLMEDKGDRNREELEKTIDRLDQKIDKTREELEKTIDRLDQKVDAMRRDMYINFRWIVGIQITTWIAVLLAILFK